MSATYAATSFPSVATTCPLPNHRSSGRRVEFNSNRECGRSSPAHLRLTSALRQSLHSIFRGNPATQARREKRARRCSTIGKAYSSLGRGSVAVSASIAPPEIAEDVDAPSDLLSALETPRYVVDYGKGAVEVAEKTAAADAKSEFRWEHHWYAVHALESIDPAVPHALTVLGRPMVLWRDASEVWKCFLDECPHRRVPLSEGRIDEKGRLACSYHAWSFTGDGKCSCIPQASAGPESRAVNNPRSSCVTFPVHVEVGTIFVWPDEKSPDLAASTPPPLPPGHNDGISFSMHVRDLPYSYEFVAENFMDPAHVTVAHHGIGPLKRDQAKPLPLKLERFDQSGFHGRMTEYSIFIKSEMELTFLFPEPGVFVFDSTALRDGKPMRRVTAAYMTPTTPGNCRVVIANTSMRPSPRMWLVERLGLLHMPVMSLLDSDAVFLHYQEVAMKAREKQGGPSWRDTYFLPTRSDLYVITFRKWLERFAHGGVKYGPGWDLRRAPGGTPEQLMDRHNGHVALCKYCTAALANYRKARVALSALAGLCLVLAGGLLGSALVAAKTAAGTKIAIPTAILLLLAALCGAGINFCNANIPKFVYMGWDHARNP